VHSNGAQDHSVKFFIKQYTQLPQVFFHHVPRDAVY